MDGTSETLELRNSNRGVLDTIGLTTESVPRVLLRDTDGGAEPPLHHPNGGDGAYLSVRYRIDGEIARGGMGTVLKGRDPDLGRDVALKVLRDDFRDNTDMIRRFVEEARIGGQLQHPGIVPIYEMGIFGDRRPFFAMKLVKGNTLAKLIDACKKPTEKLPSFLGIFESIAQTVAYSHARGVIHRDLKPSNVMVGSFGEVQVMDWGLAKVLPRGGISDDAFAGKYPHAETVIATSRSGGDESDFSQAGSVLGTPSYMAPEQARGEIERVDERADVFALGSILCELLTGQPAFSGRSSAEIQRKAALGDLGEAFARLDASGADRELIALAKECLARELEDRPRHAGEVAERVTAYLAGVQFRLRRAEIESVEERGRRRLTTVVAASLIFLGLIGGMTYARGQQQKADRLARTTRGVDEALAEAARLRGEAQAAPAGEIARWTEAISAARRAQAVLAQGESNDSLKERVRAMVDLLDQEQAAAIEQASRLAVDRTLFSDLESARGGRADREDDRSTDAEYAAAFRKAGLDIDSIEPAEAGKWLRSRSDPLELAGYLDDWAWVRIKTKAPEARWRQLVAVARATDPDPWRDALRVRIGTSDAAAVAGFQRLADDEAVEAQSAQNLILLARQLKNGAGDRDRAARVLRRAVLRYPADFWSHFELSQVHGDDSGYILYEYPRPDESVLHLTAAVAIRPGSRMARYELYLALAVQGKFDESNAVLREIVRVKTSDALGHRYRSIVYLHDRKFEDAIAETRAEIRLNPNRPSTHYGLGQKLELIGKLDEAVVAYREAIRLKPDRPIYHVNLGNALSRVGRLDESIAEYREAIRLNPDWPVSHIGLSGPLIDQGKLDAAIDAVHEAIRLDPQLPWAYDSLGLVLKRKGDYAGSLAAYRKRQEVINKQPMYQKITKFVFDPAEPSLIERAEKLVEMAPRLPALLNGDGQPKDIGEIAALALLSEDLKQYARAVRFWSAAIDADPRSANDVRSNAIRYRAAFSAVQAGSGHGLDAPVDEFARTSLREQALRWLKQDAAAWRSLLETANLPEKKTALERIQHWQRNFLFAPVRDPQAFAKLNETERKNWQALWVEVETMTAIASGQKAKP